MQNLLKSSNSSKPVRLEVVHLNYLHENSSLEKRESELRKHRMMAEYNAALLSSNDPWFNLKQLARALTDELCDGCTIELQDDDGRLQRVAAAHRDSEKLRLLDQELGSPSATRLALVSEGKEIGSLTLICSRSGISFDGKDIPFLEEVALLASRVAGTARSIQRLKRDIQLREQFLSIASHELKTPLTSLLSLVQLLLMRARGGQDSADSSLQLLEKAESQSQRMVKLINDLLDMSRMSAGRLVLRQERCDLVEVAREALERIDPQLRVQGCDLSFHAPASLHGKWDRARLEEVILNLLSNAMKYGPGKPIEVRISTIRPAEAKEMACVSVCDQGTGIAPEDQDKIFDVFERAAHAHDHLGHGLGLSIARQIVEAHQGTLRVQSTPGEGSTFTFELPRN